MATDRTFIPQARIPDLINRFRADDSFSSYYRDMDDWEVYQDIKERFPNIELDDAPSDWKYNRIQKLNSLENQKPTHSTSPYKKDDGGLETHSANWGETIANFATLPEKILSPFGLYDAYKMGVNESVTGLAYHILTGEAPFKQDIEKAFGEEGPNVWENAFSMAAGMGFDFWMFMNPITAGSALTYKLAAPAAMRATAKQVAKARFGENLTMAIGKEGFEGLTKTGIARAAKNSEDVVGMKNFLTSNTRTKGGAKLDDLAEATLTEATKDVGKYVGSKEWIRGVGKADISNKLLPKPSLQHLAFSYGTQSAKALGAYSTLQNVESQMRNSLVERYGEQAPELWNRWKTQGEWLLEDVDPWEVLYTGVHGYFGGFAAGGLMGVRAAGRAGFFEKGKFEQSLKRKHPAIQKRLYEGWQSGAGFILAEGAGFTAAGKLIDLTAKGMGYDKVPEHSLWESFVQNVTTVGTMKGLHTGLRKMTAKLKQPVEELKNNILESAVKNKARLEKVEKTAAIESEQGEKVKQSIKDDIAKRETVAAEDAQILTRAYDVIKEASRKFKEVFNNPEGNKTVKLEILKSVEAAEKQIREIAEKHQSNENINLDQLQLTLDQLNMIKDGYGNLTGKDSSLSKDIKNWNDRIEKDSMSSAEKDAQVKDKLDEYGTKQKDDVKSKDEYSERLERIEKKVNEIAESREKGQPVSEKQTNKTLIDELKLERNNLSEGNKKDALNKLIEKVHNENKKLIEKGLQDKAEENMASIWNIFKHRESTTANRNTKNKRHETLGKLIEFLADRGKSLKDITMQDVTDMSKSYAGGWKGVKEVLKRIQEVANSKYSLLEIRDKDFVLSKLPGAGQEGTRIQYIPEANILQKSIKAIGSAVKKTKKFFIGRDPKAKGNYVDLDTARAVHYISMLWGKRGVAIASTGRSIKYTKKGSKSDQEPIRLKDIKITEDKIIITLYDKAKAGSKNVKEGFSVDMTLGTIVIHKGITKKILGYDIYNIIKSLHEKRTSIENSKKGGEEKNPYLLTYTSFQGGKVLPLTKSQLDGIINNHFIRKAETKSTPHTIRHMWLTSIIPKIANAAKLNEYQQLTLQGFVDKYMLAHDNASTALQRRKEILADVNAPTGTANTYTGKQLPVVTSFKQKMIMEIYDALQKGKLNEKKFEDIIKSNEKQFREIEGKDLFINKDSPFSQLPSRESSIGSKKQQVGLSEHRVATSKELVNQFIDQLPKNKGLKLKFLKGKEYAGEFIDGVIRLVEGKADLTTFFHENVHRLEAFVRDSGNKKLIKAWERGEKTIGEWAKKNDSVRWNEFVRKYGDKAANEYLTQLSAEWSLKKSQTTTIGGRLRNWFKELTSKVKSMLGIANAKDVSRIFGSIAEKGFSTEGVSLTGRKFSKITKGDLVDKQQIKDLEKALKDTGIKDIEALYIKLATDLGMQPVKRDSLTQSEYAVLRDHIDTVEFIVKSDGTYKKKRKPTWIQLRRDVASKNRLYGIGKETEKLIKKHIGISGGTMKNASEMQMKRYLDILNSLGEPPYNYKTMTPDSIINSELAYKVSQSDSKILLNPLVGRWMLPVDYVLRKLGASGVADLMLDHYQFESGLKGVSAYRINNAIDILNKEYGKHRYHNGRKMFNDYMGYAMDKESRAGARIDGRGREFLEKADNVKTSAEYKAVQEMRKMTDFFFDTFLEIGKATIKNPRQLEKWLEQNSKLYVQEYFTRVPTKEGKKYLEDNRNDENIVIRQMASIVEAVVKDRNSKIDKLKSAYDKSKPTSIAKTKEYRKKIKELERERDNIAEALTDKSNTEYTKLRQTAERQVYDLGQLRKNIVHNPYLLKRVPRLPNVFKDGNGKEIFMYETNFDKVMGRYINVMSNYLATAKYFPSFTNMRSSFIKGNESMQRGNEGDLFAQHLKVLSAEGSMQGAYVELAVKKRIGLAESDISNKPLDFWLNQAGRYSAMFGLSSPMSGLKNLVIGTTNTIGIFGMSNYLKSIAFMLGPESKLVKKELQKLGAGEIGTKEIELTGFPDFIMRNISKMKPTEVANRFYSAWAGLLTAEQLVNRLRGDRLGLFSKMRAESARKELKSKFELSDKEILHLQNHGLRKGQHGFDGQAANSLNAKNKAIRDKILHYSHIITQGATAEPFLPLWAANNKISSLTLFYRMAYSGTYNIMKHVVQPMKNGNVLPMARYLFAGQVMGAGLWAIYDSIMGNPPPKINESELDRFSVNAAKAETLGLFGFVFSPFDQSLFSDSIMRPAIIRNTNTVLTHGFNAFIAPFAYKMGLKKKPVDSVESFQKLATDMVPLISHSLRTLEKKNNPYKTNMRKLKTFKKSFMNKQEDGESLSDKETGVKTKIDSPNSMYYNLIEEAFLNNDLESAARYYWTTRLYLYDNSRHFRGREDYTSKQARANVDSQLKNMLKGINPMNFPKALDVGQARRIRYVNKRNMFMGKDRYDKKSYLNDEYRKVAWDAEKTYYHRMRQLEKHIDKYEKHYNLDLYYHRGEMIDPFPIPPRRSYGGKRLYTMDERWMTVKSKQSKRVQ